MGTQFTFVFLLFIWMPIVVWAQPCPAGKYQSQAFDSVTVHQDLLYGAVLDYKGDTIDLFLDVYEPHGDTSSLRPLIIWVHGGGFYAGQKEVDPITWNPNTKMNTSTTVRTRIIFLLSGSTLFQCSSSVDTELPKGWGPIGGATGNVRFWEYNSTGVKDGSPGDMSRRHPVARQLTIPEDSALIVRYRDPAFVLDRWTPKPDYSSPLKHEGQ